MNTLQKRIEIASLNLPRGWKTRLAEKCGVSTASVSGWICGGTSTINMEHLFDAAEFFGVSPKWLGTGLGPMRQVGVQTWPFVAITQDEWASASDRLKGQIEGYARSLLDQESRRAQESQRKIAA